MPIKRYPFNKRWYVLDVDAVDGFCVHPGPIGVLFVNDKLRGRRRLETLLHECMHADFPERPHKDLTRAAALVAEILWDQGYRRPGEKKDGG